MRVRSFETSSLALVAGISVVGWLIFGSYKVFIGVWTGGIVGIVNFKWLGRIARNALRHKKDTGTAGYVARYLLKLTIIAIVLALLFYSSRLLDPLAFVVGFTLTVITVSVFGADLINRS